MCGVCRLGCTCIIKHEGNSYLMFVDLLQDNLRMCRTSRLFMEKDGALCRRVDAVFRYNDLGALGDWVDVTKKEKVGAMALHYSSARYSHSFQCKMIVVGALPTLKGYET